MPSSFGETFERLWAKPSVEDLEKLLHPKVRLLQPHKPMLEGKEKAVKEFLKLFRWLPTIRGEVTRSSQTGDAVFVEWVMLLPIGSKVVRLEAVDRFLLEDGLVKERAVYFDQMTLFRAVLLSPRSWLGFLRYRFGR